LNSATLFVYYEGSSKTSTLLFLAVTGMK